MQYEMRACVDCVQEINAYSCACEEHTFLSFFSCPSRFLSTTNSGTQVTMEAFLVIRDDNFLCERQLKYLNYSFYLQPIKLKPKNVFSLKKGLKAFISSYFSK